MDSIGGAEQPLGILRDRARFALQRLDYFRRARRGQTLRRSDDADRSERRAARIADRHAESADPGHDLALAHAVAAALRMTDHPLQRAHARIAEPRDALQIVFDDRARFLFRERDENRQSARRDDERTT